MCREADALSTELLLHLSDKGLSCSTSILVCSPSKVDAPGRIYQRSRRGPVKAPSAPVSRIPREYQISTKGMPFSVQNQE